METTKLETTSNVDVIDRPAVPLDAAWFERINAKRAACGMRLLDPDAPRFVARIEVSKALTRDLNKPFAWYSQGEVKPVDAGTKWHFANGFFAVGHTLNREETLNLADLLDDVTRVTQPVDIGAGMVLMPRDDQPGWSIAARMGDPASARASNGNFSGNDSRAFASLFRPDDFVGDMPLDNEEQACEFARGLRFLIEAGPWF